MSRYVVTELEGYMYELSVGGTAREGLSCHVIDTAWNHRLVATYRTEDESRRATQTAKRRMIRGKAYEHALRLNAA